MSNAVTIILLILALPVSWYLTGLVRHYAIANKILDVPNARSSHSKITPRGGGLAIAVTFLSGVVLLAILKEVDLHVGIALCGGGALVASVGWLDDKKGLGVLTRAVVHLLAAIWVLAWLGGLNQLSIGTITWRLGIWGTPIAVVAFVWAINLYNFMDGIDGLAATEAVSVGMAASLFLVTAGSRGLASLSLLLALSAGGFLLWNWPPARIFMGDVGSGFLGFSFATLALATEVNQILPALIWAVLLGVFLVDATATLIRRVIQGECWYKAHRTHAYQIAVQYGYTHKQVTLCVLAINVVLSVLAGIAFMRPEWLLTVVACSVGLLLALQIRIIQLPGKELVTSPRNRSRTVSG